jgi:diguanylate cyclase (GGDEF)-like protein
VPVEPVLALLVVAVVANLALVALAILPAVAGRRGMPDGDERGGPPPGLVRLAATAGRPEAELLPGEVPPGTYDRAVRVVAWVYLLAVAAIVVLTGYWLETQTAILIVVLLAGLAIVVVNDVLAPDALGPAKPVIEGSIAITVASALVLLTGQAASPFFFTFPLVVGGAALVVGLRSAVVLTALASLAYVAAVAMPIGGPALDQGDVVTVAVNLTAMVLLVYVGLVVGREQRRSREAAIRASTVDALTGLFNRPFLFAAVEREIARSSRSGRGFCLLMMDLDELKPVNDHFGHHVGDRLLRRVGEVIRIGVRRIDTPARYGGDEFAVLAPETDPTGAFVLAEKIRQGVTEVPIETAEGAIHPTLSIGVVAYPDDGGSADALFIAADQAMYASKRAGRNRVSGTTGRVIAHGGPPAAV